MKNRDRLQTMQADRLLWAIHPAALAQFRSKMESEAWLDEEDEEDKKKATPPSLLTVKDGIGTIPVTGSLMSENHWLYWWFGETSYEGIQRATQEARNRTDVEVVKMLTDSPGGLVAGAHDTSDAVRQLAQVKPVVAYNANMMTSAAYWVNTHATQIVSTPTGFVGSTGVATVHREISGFEKRMGIKSKDIASGDLKRIASFYEPLTAEAEDYIRQQCVDCAQVFVGDVATARKMTAEQKTEVARAGTYLGAQAMSLGLVDAIGLGHHADLIVNTLRESKKSFIDLGGNLNNSTNSDKNNAGGTEMDEKELKAAERKRIADIRALAPVGLEVFVDALAFDEKGYTVEQAAVLILAEQKKNPPKVATPEPAEAAPATATVTAATPTQEALNQFVGEGTPPLKVDKTDAATTTKDEGEQLMIEATQRRNAERKVRQARA